MQYSHSWNVSINVVQSDTVQISKKKSNSSSRDYRRAEKGCTVSTMAWEMIDDLDEIYDLFICISLVLVISF